MNCEIWHISDWRVHPARPGPTDRGVQGVRRGHAWGCCVPQPGGHRLVPLG
nr:MAG TPA: hypothetical protein [Caudoviricetes sp.]